MARPLRQVAARVAIALLLLAGACGSDDDDGERAAPTTGPAPSTTTTAGPAASTTAPPASTTTSTSSTTGGDATGPPPQVRATELARFDAALGLAARAGDDNLYVAEQGGRVRAVRQGQTDAAVVLDVSAEVSSGGERGLLGLAFSPDGSRLYVNYTDREGDTRVVEYAFAGGRADAGSRRLLLTVEQPFANHNGGHLAFGPDGMLYIGLGDGGGGGDPMDNGQRLDTLLGKILRIDPRAGGGQPYTVPPDNPFVGRDGARPEIWAYGLRNPWRFSFDRAGGTLWIGDVGQNSREEVDRAGPGSKGGENYGWNRFEGSRPFQGRAPGNHVPPVYDYGTGNGNCAVTGGFVYRGQRIPGLRGRYVFGDYCRGEVLALVPDGNAMRAVAIGPRLRNLASFGEDGAGELYVISTTSGLLRLDPA
jgi:glucose/arabinose dehydrogenase